MKNTKLFESNIISLYKNALNEAEKEKKEKKEDPAVAKFLDSTVKNPKTGNKVKVTTVLKDPENPLHDKVKDELEKVKDASKPDVKEPEGIDASKAAPKEKDEVEEDNPEENVKTLTKNIEDERIAVEASKNKIKELEKEKKSSTDPDSFDKAIQKEKTRIEQGEEDIKEMKIKKDAEKKKATTETPETPATTETPADVEEDPKKKLEKASKNVKRTEERLELSRKKIEQIKSSGKGDLEAAQKEEDEMEAAVEKAKKEKSDLEGGDEESPKEGDKDKIESLKKEIDKLESVYDSKKESTANKYQSLAEKTDSLASNGLLESFVSTERAKAKLEFNEKIISFLEDPKQIEKKEEENKELNSKISEDEKERTQAQKDADEKFKNDEKFTQAKEETAGAESTEEKPEKEKAEVKEEPKEEESKSPEDIAKEQKKKEVEYSLGVLTSKIDKVKDAHNKAKEEGKDLKVLGAINKNYQEMKKAIEDLKAEKEKLGESFDSIELEIWALDVAVTTLLEQIESGYLFE